MGGKTYTELFDVINDLQLYLAVKQRTPIDLSMLPSLAKHRYSWIVTNWNTLFAKFKAYADGDQYLEAALEDFDSSVRSYKLGNTANVLDNSQKFNLYRDFIALILLSNIGITPGEQTLVNQETQRISNLVIQDFRSMLAFLKQDAAILSSQIGLGDADGFSALGVASAPRTHAATIKDLSVSDSLVTLMKYVESIIVLLRQTTDTPPNLLTIANANISNNQTVSISSAFASSVAVPFEISLEHMAEKYMGDASLWYTLVTVNNLQPPYVDEVGEKFPLLAPGANNSIIISSSRSNDVHVGSKIKVGSRTVREEERFVNNLTKNSDNTMVLFLSGDPDLAKLKTTHSSFVRIYQPHTTNGGSFILIPVAIPSSLGKSLTPQNDELRRLEKSLLNFGVDIAQNSTTGDFIIDANGNFGLAYGIKNVQQAVKNGMKTVIGELPFHVDYGLDLDVGARFNGPTNVAAVVSNIVTKTILKDTRIQSAQVKSLVVTGNSIAMLVEVTIAGSNNTIPLSFVG